MEYLRVLGCCAFFHIPKAEHSKWGVKAKEIIFGGYCEDKKGYRLIDPSTYEIVSSRDVHFLENQMYHRKTDTASKFYNDSSFSGSIINSSDAEEINSSVAEGNDRGNETESVIGDNSENNTLSSIDTIDDHSENASVSNADNQSSCTDSSTQKHYTTRSLSGF